MEEDDEFGDLYMDVIRPLEARFQPQHKDSGPDAASVKAAASQDRSVDLNFDRDDEKTPHLKAGTALGWNLNSSTQEKTLPARGGFNLNLDSNSEATARIDGLVGKGVDGSGFEAKVLENGHGLPSFMDDDDDLNIILEEREEKGEELVEKNNNNFMIKEDRKYAHAVREEFTMNFVNDAAVDEMGPEQSIPGICGRMENPSAPNILDEWESEESDDDLQIVLNDSNHGPMGIERMPGMIDDDKDDDGEPLVIVVDNGDVGHHHHQAQRMVGEQEPVGEEEGCGDTEKALSDASKASGEGGVDGPAAAQTKIVYSNQSFHNPFSSQFKYVRPGAATLPGAAAGGITGQIRPPISMVPPAGRGSGVWSPAEMKWPMPMPMQKGYHPGYGILARGVNVAGRGSGLDFSLPSYKSIFEVDIDSFEEKPWKLPGIDVSDFFNFGLNEDSWRDYCKQLGQLRLEMTMQSRVRAHESGKAEQNYDPDIPPELAAAVGRQDNPSENANHGKIDAGPDSGRRTSPVGRPIPVETGSCDRLPSIDTRRLRMHDMDAIIEIICHSSKDGDDVSKQQDNDPARKDHVGGGDETDGLQQDDGDHMVSFSPEYNGDKWGFDSRRPLPKNTVHNDDILGEDVSHLPSEVNGHPRTDRVTGPPHEERSKKGRRHVRLPFMSASESTKENIAGNLKEESYRAGDGKQRPASSSSLSVGSDRECVVVVGDEIDDDSVMDDRSLKMARVEIASDPWNRGTCEDGDLIYSTKKQKLSLLADSGEYEDRRDSNTARSNDCSARSGSSEYLQLSPGDVDDKVLQHRHSLRAGKNRREVRDEGIAHRKDSYGGEEAGRQNTVVKEREGFFSRRGGHANSSLHLHGKTGSGDWWKESDISEGTGNRRDEHRHGGKERLEDPRKREHGLEFSSRNQDKPREIEKNERDDHRQSRNQLHNGSWMGTNHEYDIIGSRQRDRGDHLNSRSERVDDLHSTRRYEELHVRRVHAEMDDISHSHIECSTRRKRERDDGSDEDDEVHYARQKKGGLSRRGRSEKLRERDQWHWINQDDHLLRRERIETRPMMRSALAAEEKAWISHLRGNDDYNGSSREYHLKDIGWNGNLFKQRDRVENYFLHQRSHEDVYALRNQLINDEKRSRYNKSTCRDDHVCYGSDTSRMCENKRKQTSRKSRETDSGDHSSLIPPKRNQGEDGGSVSETANLSGRAEQRSDRGHTNHQSSRKHRDDASTDNEQTDSRRRHSKLERWTSHKETDLATTPTASSSLKKRDRDTYNSRERSLVTRALEYPSGKIEDNPQPLVENEDTGPEMNDNDTKAAKNRHLDTVAKLKKRSERFKLPLPTEKDSTAIKKTESEQMPLVKAETSLDSDIKSERPARKRRWTSN